MRSSWIQWGLTGLVFASIIFMGYRVSLHRQAQSHDQVSSPAPSQPADAWIQEFTYRQTQDGAPKWEVVAERAQVFESQHRAYLHDVRVRLLGAGHQEMIVHADRGIIDTATHNFQLSNQEQLVSIAFQDGYRVRSNHLQWIEATHQFKTQDPVEIQGHGLTITGTGLVAELDADQFTILDDVHAQIQ